MNCNFCFNESNADKLLKIAASGLYECVICMDRVKQPVKCSTCHKIICKDHIRRLENRCPNCRSSPFDYYEDPTFTKIV